MLFLRFLKPKEASEYECKNDAENKWRSGTMQITSGKRWNKWVGISVTDGRTYRYTTVHKYTYYIQWVHVPMYVCYTHFLIHTYVCSCVAAAHSSAYTLTFPREWVRQRALNSPASLFVLLFLGYDAVLESEKIVGLLTVQQQQWQQLYYS